MATTTETLVWLESGDRLTREDFHRRYDARPDIRRAELINGVVYVPSPTRFDVHDEPATIMVTWLAMYALGTPDVRSGSNASIFLTDDGEVQPDGFLFCDTADASVRRTPDGYLEGAPELVSEVAASSASYDLHDKKELYRRAGVQEYLVWRVLDHGFDWFDLQADQYVRREPDDRGVIASRMFTGLRLNVTALLAGDYAGVIAELTAAEPP